MKRLHFLYLLALIVGLGFTACNDDDLDPEPGCDVFAGPCPTLVEERVLDRTCDDGSAVSLTIVDVTDLGEGTGTTRWTSDKVYILNGLVFVNDGQTLTIEPGTIIKGRAGQTEEASALVVARGGKLIADGTADDPIVFTSQADGIYRTPSGDACTESTLDANTRGLWGGLIILGKAGITADTEERAIEGIPTSEARGLYGGSEDGDNSGTLRYVSIRHGGTDIGAGNEINGLTMGGVGNGTVIENVEVFANNDDGFEWFGGTVNTKNLVAAFCGDDSFDYDEGWRGSNQFWLAYQLNVGDRGGEHDGGPSSCETCTPFAIPVIYNATYVGQGEAAGTRAVSLRDNAGGKYYNSIFVDYGRGVDIEYLPGSDDSFKQAQDGNLEFRNNIFFNVATGGDLFTVTNGSDDENLDISAQEAELAAIVADWNNTTADPELESLQPRAAVVTDDLAPAPTDNFIEAVDYKGAVSNTGTPWIAGWSRLAQEL